MEQETQTEIESTQESNSQTDGQATSQQQGDGETPAPRPFRGTRIEGKDEEYATSYIQTLEQAVRQQREQLDRMQATTTVPANPIVEQPHEKPKDFFEDPSGAVESILRREMQKQVEPLRRQLERFSAVSQVEQLWDRVASRYPQMPQLRPVMENMMTQLGITPEQTTEEVIEHFYFTARGRAVEQGGGASSSAGSRTVIPQHRPSSAPPPAPPASNQRQLTEAERRLAREFGMSAEEYARLQDDTIEFEDYRVKEQNNG